MEALIRKLVREKLDDGQLNDSALTFSDLDKICSTFVTVLTGVFHERIEYPEISIPPRKPVEEEPPAEEAAAQFEPETNPTDEAAPEPAEEDVPQQEVQSDAH